MDRRAREPVPTRRLIWVGEDERGRELEIVAIEKADYILVIHVMPTHDRRNAR